MDYLEILAYAALGTGAGVLIGCVGIGGVILVPALVYLAGRSPQAAIAAAMCAFVVSGIVGIYAYSKAGSIRWHLTKWTWAGALPSAFAGALLLNSVTPRLLEMAIGLLTAGSGLHALANGRRGRAMRERALPPPSLAAIGAVTGFVSALTGTGGPLVLVPILVSLDMPMLASIGLAQAIQLPIAAAATGGNVLSGALDVPLGLTLAGGIALGTWIGAKAAHALPVDALRKLVAAMLVLVGGAMLGRLVTA